MNTLELRPGGEGVEVRIDGHDLRDLVRAVELPHAAADGQPDLAGSYDGLPPGEWVLPPADGKGHVVAVLGCTCGVTECWPLLVRITRKADVVVWSDFRQPRRGWPHEGLGPFTFDRAQYDSALAALTAESGSR
ncbi:MAG TPA: hypothetical protein VLK84_00440 [Longimicrobium sp.]|nr:hypothetical protein [Longimicrobium sp.]